MHEAMAKLVSNEIKVDNAASHSTVSFTSATLYDWPVAWILNKTRVV